MRFGQTLMTHPFVVGEASFAPGAGVSLGTISIMGNWRSDSISLSACAFEPMLICPNGSQHQTFLLYPNFTTFMYLLFNTFEFGGRIGPVLYIKFPFVLSFINLFPFVLSFTHLWTSFYLLYRTSRTGQNCKIY